MSDYTYTPQLLEIHVTRADDSVEIIDLLHGGDGAYLANWVPADNEDKGGGVFEDSPMHEGEGLIHSVIGNANEGIELALTGSDSANCWRVYNRIQLAIEQGKAYSKRHRGAKPVYLALQVPGLPIQYASIVTGAIKATGQPFRVKSPSAMFLSALSANMVINREAWQESPPGQSTAYARGQTNTFDDVVYGDSTFAGATDYSATRKVFITNKRQQNNITRQYAYDDTGGTYTALGGSLPYTLTMDETQDAIYFGIEDFTDYGPFDSLIFDIGTPASATTSYDLAYEYWDGSGWSSLNTVDNTSELSLTGVRGLFWDRPDDWTPGSLSTMAPGAPAISGYWMRIRVNALTGTLTAPTQQNRRIYTVVNPFIEVLADTVTGGGIATLIRMLIRKERVSFPSPLTRTNVVCGLRSGDSPNFDAYINLSDIQNNPGITISAGTHAALIDDVSAPTGRAIRYTPSGSLDTYASRVVLIIDSTISGDWVGKYRAYLRCGPSAAGTTWTFKAGIRTLFSSTTDLFTSQPVSLPSGSSADFAPVDLGLINLTTFSHNSNNADVIIDLYIKASSNARTLDLYDLVLIPSNEWIGHFKTVDEDSAAYYDLDSVTDSRGRGIVAYGKDSSDDHILFPIEVSASGRAVAQPGKNNRYWFFVFDSYSGIASPSQAINIEISGVRRWRGVRDEQ